MTRKITSAITMVLALVAVAPDARAEVASRAYVDSGLAGKMNAMTVDSAPTANSTNLVTSGGVKTYVDTQKDEVISGDMESLTELAEELDYTTSEAIEQAKELGVAGLMLRTEVDSNELWDAIDGNEDRGYPGKQDVLGGGSDAGKVVTAGSTAGTVTYTAIDSTPTENSTNLVTSGGVADAIEAAIPTIDSTPTANSTNLITSGAVADIGSNAIAIEQQQPDSFFFINSDGDVRTVSGIAPQYLQGGIGLNLLRLPSPPSSCSTNGCMLMFYNNQYVWEPVGRDTNETISTSGAVNGTNYAAYPVLDQVRAADGTMVGPELPEAN